MIRIEPDTSTSPVLFTNAQFLAAAEIIMADDDSIKLHYDLTEERTKFRGITRTKLMLWAWPTDRTDTPTRTWIDEAGEVQLVEDVDWITDEEWPAWAGTTDANHYERKQSND
jgi:hypothetical protein